MSGRIWWSLWTQNALNESSQWQFVFQITNALSKQLAQLCHAKVLGFRRSAIVGHLEKKYRRRKFLNDEVSQIDRTSTRSKHRQIAHTFVHPWNLWPSRSLYLWVEDWKSCRINPPPTSKLWKHLEFLEQLFGTYTWCLIRKQPLSGGTHSESYFEHCTWELATMLEYCKKQQKK